MLHVRPYFPKVGNLIPVANKCKHITRNGIGTHKSEAWSKATGNEPINVAVQLQFYSRHV